MSRKSKRRVKSGRRVADVNANRALSAGTFLDLERELIYDRARLPLPYVLPMESVYGRRLELQSVSDRRVWHPLDSARAAVDIYGQGHRLQVATRRTSGFGRAVPLGISFWRPSKVLVCIRRRMRREVMHALGIAGQSGLRPPRRNWTSEISCEG